MTCIESKLNVRIGLPLNYRILLALGDWYYLHMSFADTWPRWIASRHPLGTSWTKSRYSCESNTSADWRPRSRSTFHSVPDTSPVSSSRSPVSKDCHLVNGRWPTTPTRYGSLLASAQWRTKSIPILGHRSPMHGTLFFRGLISGSWQGESKL